MTTNPPPQNSRRNWRDRAECRKPVHDPETWWPIGTTNPAAVAQANKAKRVCRGCPVLEACLQGALDTGQDTGIWGGLDEDERRKMRRRAAERRQRPDVDPAALRLADRRRDAIRRMVIGQRLPVRHVARRLGVTQALAGEAIRLLGLDPVDQPAPRVHLVLKHRDRLEEMAAQNLSSRQMAKQIGIPGVTRNVIDDALQQLRIGRKGPVGVPRKEVAA
jgi:WhiB family redox-sensing transcriptional regulator